MGFHNVLFPDHLSVGSRLGPGYRTRIVETENATEYRTGRLTEPIYRYDVARSVQSASDVAEVLNFYHARRGSLYSFKFLDSQDKSTESDHTTAPTTSSTLTTIGTGDASETQFQLLKVYDDGTYTQTVNVRLPISGTVIVKVAGVLQVEGVDYTVGYTTGVVTFDAGSIPGIGETVAAGCQYYRKVRFAKTVDEWLPADGDQNMSHYRSIPLVGVRDLVEGSEMLWHGGSAQESLTGDVTITRDEGRLRSFDPDAGGHKVNLPDPAAMERGGPHFALQNESGSFTFVAYDPVAASTIVTVSTSSIAELWVRKNGSGNNEWVAF